MTQVPLTDTWGLSEHDEELVKLCATNLLEDVPELGVAVACHIHDQAPEIGGDPAAIEATRRSCVANLRELCIMLRAGLPATAHETPTEALEYARFMRGRGVGLPAIHRCYQLGVSMFSAVAAGEFERCADDVTAVRRMAAAVDAFVWGYAGRVLERLGEEYGGDHDNGVPGLESPVWRDPTSARAAAEFLAGRATTHDSAVTQARRTAEAALDRFQAIIDAAARNERVGRRLAQARTSVRIELADEPDLFLTLLMDGKTIAATRADVPAEIELSLSSVDLERTRSEDFNLSMAIARGRVQVAGPVRKFLRVMPIVRRLPDPTEAEAEGRLPPGAPTNGARSDAEPRFDPETESVLERAAHYESRRDGPHYEEEAPGHFWSIECRGVYKTLGADVVLNGLDVGIPEGMITVVLGPSGTSKSVFISHLVGLMLPDRGEVRVHGQSVAELRTNQLVELRRRFGILFQDGALFGSMNVFDNVAFPLRKQGDLPESDIKRLVDSCRADVGLGGAGERMPSDLTVEMRERAGIARALVMDPEIVVFDEPDAVLGDLIKRLHAEHGGTYVVITHDVAAARRVADYLVVLWNGRIVQSGDRDDMFTSPNPFVRQFLAGRSTAPVGTN
jgi:phospholipid/cholesterol/gamma-HCH transport system ATP-binding protein